MFMMLPEPPVSVVLVASHVAQQIVEISTSRQGNPSRMKHVVAPVEMEEEQAFLADEEQAGEEGETSLCGTKSLSRSTSPYTSLPVYGHIDL
jgi:hypothetical protein